MRVQHVLRYGLVLGSLALGACSDNTTAPEPAAPDPSASLVGGLLPLGGNTVEVAHRTVPLAEDEVASAVVGKWGGILRLPRAGLTVVIPPGALRGEQRITVTAPAGDLVGYHFAPHGLEFRRTASVFQDLDNTDVGLLDNPVAAYFEGDLGPLVEALEILRLNLIGLLGIAEFRIDHFSGYVIATD